MERKDIDAIVQLIEQAEVLATALSCSVSHAARTLLITADVVSKMTSAAKDIPVALKTVQ